MPDTNLTISYTRSDVLYLVLSGTKKRKCGRFMSEYLELAWQSSISDL